jgi:hypothetical protein
VFLPGEDQLGKHQVAIISHALWESQFGSDPNIINRVVKLDGQPHTIVGVLPKAAPSIVRRRRSGGRWRSCRRT